MAGLIVPIARGAVPAVGGLAARGGQSLSGVVLPRLQSLGGAVATGGAFTLGGGLLNAGLDWLTGGGSGGGDGSSASGFEKPETAGKPRGQTPEGDEYYDYDEEDWGEPGGAGGGEGYVTAGGFVPEGVMSVTPANSIANKRWQVVPVLTQEAKDWLSRELSARGWTIEQVSNPWLLAACMVAQAMVPPPQECMVPSKAKDWLSSTGFGDDSIGRKFSQRDSAFEAACKYGLRVALATRLGLAFVDSYPSRSRGRAPARRATTTTTRYVSRSPRRTVTRSKTTRKR